MLRAARSCRVFTAVICALASVHSQEEPFLPGSGEDATTLPRVGDANFSVAISPRVQSSLVCRNGEPVSIIRNHFVTSTLSERHWQFTCGQSSFQLHHFPSAGWVEPLPVGNDSDAILCPSHSFLSGVSLENGQLTRHMRFHCSSLPEDYMITGCQTIPYPRHLNFSAVQEWPSVWTGAVVEKHLLHVDGTWKFYVCRVAMSQCSPPSGLDVVGLPFRSGSIRYIFNTTIHFHCQGAGYFISQPSSATCRTHGEWDNIPACIACTTIRNCLKVECTSSEDQVCKECRATSAGGLRLVPSKNKCRGLPEVVSTNQTAILFNTNDTVLIPCKGRGIPKPRLEWSWDSVVDSTKSVASNHSLIISNMTHLDAGNYTCTATNSVGVAMHTVTLYFQQLPQQPSLPVITGKGTYLCILEQDVAGRMDCMAAGFPPPTITWGRLEGNRLVRVPLIPNLRVRQLANGSLGFYPVRQYDFAQYRCTASNQAGVDHLDLILFVPDSDYDPGFKPLEEPHIINFARNYTAPEGSNITLSCAATGNPPPIITWLVNGKRRYSINGTLVLATVSFDDSGVYQCLAFNGGSAFAEATVVVVHEDPATMATVQTTPSCVDCSTASGFCDYKLSLPLLALSMLLLMCLFIS